MLERRSRGRGAVCGAALLALATPWLAGCSVRKVAVRTLGSAMASTGDVFAGDEDPELVAQALPFALKTMEGLLAEDPSNRGLLLATARGFTQYAHAFVAQPADLLEAVDFERAEAERERALKLFLRARGYALRGLEATHPGIGERLVSDPAAAAAELGREDLDLAYWAAASWGAAIASGKDRPELLADLPAVRALLERALALDESWSDGAVHEAFISLEAATPAAFGGSPERAREHFTRAVELTDGHAAGPYVTLAESVAVPAQDRAEFEALLGKAQAVDVDAVPARRLANVLAQRRAAWLLSRADELFFEEEEGEEGEGDGGAGEDEGAGAGEDPEQGEPPPR